MRKLLFLSLLCLSSACFAWHDENFNVSNPYNSQTNNRNPYHDDTSNTQEHYNINGKSLNCNRSCVGDYCNTYCN